MLNFTMKIETDNEVLFRKVAADSARQAIELTAKNLFWILDPDEQLFSISIEEIGDLPALINL